MSFSLHAYYCAEHVAALRLRISEMREPPLGLETVPDDYLEILFDEIIAAPTTGELLLGVYETALPALRDALQRHLAETNPLADHPSVRVIRFALLEIGEMLALGQATIDELVDEKQRAEAQSWLGLLNQCLTNAGVLEETAEPALQPVERQHSAKPYRYDSAPRRDERFPDPVTFWLSPLSSFWSRKFEYEADAFASDAIGTSGPMITALRKLSRENLANLTPHPWYSGFHYDHPALLEREVALKALNRADSPS